MRFASTFSALSAFAALAVADPGDATDADAQLVQTQLYNVGNATVALDNVVLNFTGPADTNSLVSASSAVLDALKNGAANIQPIQGNITLNQGVIYLLNPTYALNAVVAKAINDTINEKQLLVNSCLGPAVLETLNQQLNGSLTFRNTIASKFSDGNKGLVINLSQPSIDQLNYGIGNFSDQTALPASCTSTSSATSSTPTPTALPTTSDADLAIVVQQFQNIEATTQQLDYDITNFTGTADVAKLQADSNTVISTINAAVNAVNAIGPYITLGQASNSLLPQLNILKPLVNQTVTDAENAKPKFVAACVGPQILDALKQQYTSAVAFANAVANKIDPAYQALTLQLSQPVIDSLQQGIDYYADQTSLPASCTATSSSAAPTSTSTSSIVIITSSSVVVTTTPVSVPVTTTTTSDVPTTSSTVVVAPSSTPVSSPASSAAATPVSVSSVTPPRASSSGAAVSSPVSSAKVSTPVSSQKASSTGAVSSPVSSPATSAKASSTGAVSSPVSSPATSAKASSTGVASSPVSSPATSAKASSTGAVSSPVSSPVIGVGSSAVSSPVTSAKASSTGAVSSPATSAKASSTGSASSPVSSPATSAKASSTAAASSVKASSTAVKSSSAVVSSPTTLITSVRTSSTSPVVTSTKATTSSTSTAPKTTATTSSTKATTTTPTTTSTSAAGFTLPAFTGIAFPTINFSIGGLALPTNIAGLFGGL